MNLVPIATGIDPYFKLSYKRSWRIFELRISMSSDGKIIRENVESRRSRVRKRSAKYSKVFSEII